MMKSTFGLFSLLLLFFSSSGYCLPGSPPLNITLNKKNAKIGELIKGVISMEAPQSASVLWIACDKLLKNNPQIDVLSAVAIRQGQLFRYEFVFTVAKAGTVALGKLPAIINLRGRADTLFTGIVSIEFNTDSIPERLTDIAPISTSVFNMPGKAILPLTAGVLFFSVTAYLYWLKQKKRPVSIGQIRANSLKKLDTIGSQISATSADVAVVEQITAVFNEYLHNVGEPTGHNTADPSLLNTKGVYAGKLDSIRELSGQMRFAGKQTSPALLNEHLQDVRVFIINYPGAL